MPESIEGILSKIDSQYSQTYHLGMLKFLAQSTLRYVQLESCKDVPDVYKELKKKCSGTYVAVALLRHMLRATGYDKEAELQSLNDHCADDFDLRTVAPSLPFYELLLILAKKLHRNNNYRHFLEYTDDDKLNKSKHNILSPIDMLQSMILKGTIVHDNLGTLTDALIVPLNVLGMSSEAQFLEQSQIQSCKH